MTENENVRLTPFRERIMRLARRESVISVSDVVRMDGRQGNGIKRAAAKQLQALVALGLLSPCHHVEFTLSTAGQRWIIRHPETSS